MKKQSSLLDLYNLKYFTLLRFQELLTFEEKENVVLNKILKSSRPPIARIPDPPSFNEMKKKELLTRDETMHLLSISNATLHRWTKDKVIKSYGIKGRIYFKFSELINTLIELK